jgi:ABC-type transport system involved in Fe-S cluster assembly fused permease/ATPase subunit
MKLEPKSSLTLERRQPITIKEEMSIRFISILTKRAYRIRGEKLESVSCSQLAQHCQPYGEAVSWERPLLPNYTCPLDRLGFIYEEIICTGCKKTPFQSASLRVIVALEQPYT